MLSPEMQQSANILQECYRELQSQNSNVVWELLKSHETTHEWTHYPENDIHDTETHSQYYYHSHPSHDPDRVAEHGHFHLFFRKPAMPEAAPIITVSDKYKNSEGKKDNLCHIMAIAMNDKGLPTSLFTTNFWVVNGLWYSAADICAVLDKFTIQKASSPFATTNLWITHMVKLFLPHIKLLLAKRDEVIADWQAQHPEVDALRDRTLEVTSILAFS